MDAVRTILTDREKRNLNEFFTVDSILRVAAPGLRADERGAARPDLLGACEGVRADLPVGRGPDGRREDVVLYHDGSACTGSRCSCWPCSAPCSRSVTHAAGPRRCSSRATARCSSWSCRFSTATARPLSRRSCCSRRFRSRWRAERLVAAYRGRKPPSVEDARDSRPGLHHRAFPYRLRRSLRLASMLTVQADRRLGGSNERGY